MFQGRFRRNSWPFPAIPRRNGRYQRWCFSSVCAIIWHRAPWNGYSRPTRASVARSTTSATGPSATALGPPVSRFTLGTRIINQPNQPRSKHVGSTDQQHTYKPAQASTCMTSSHVMLPQLGMNAAMPPRGSIVYTGACPEWYGSRILRSPWQGATPALSQMGDESDREATVSAKTRKTVPGQKVCKAFLKPRLGMQVPHRTEF